MRWEPRFKYLGPLNKYKCLGPQSKYKCFQPKLPGAEAPKQQQIQVSAALNKKNCEYPMHQIQTFEQT